MGYWVYMDELPTGGGGGSDNGCGCAVALVIAAVVFGFLATKFGFKAAMRITLWVVVIAMGIQAAKESLEALIMYILLVLFVVFWVKFSFVGALVTAVLAFICWGGVFFWLTEDNIIIRAACGVLCIYLFVRLVPLFFELVIKPLFHIG